MAQLILTAVGADRPGLVGDLTGLLFKRGANLADSRMVNLRGQFAVLMLVDGSEQLVGELRQSLPAEAQKLGLTVSFGGQAGAAPFQGVPFKLKTYSMDQPGIVHRLSRFLQEQGINIEELHTRLESGAFMGAPLFTLELKMTVPPGVQVKKLRGELEQVCDSLNCDFDLEPAQ